MNLCYGIIFCSFDESLVMFEKSTIVCNRRWLILYKIHVRPSTNEASEEERV